MQFFKNFRKVFLTILAVSILTLPSFAHAEDARYSSLVIDADTGAVLHQDNAGKTRYPASLTKMMTLYLTFQALDRGTLTMNKMMSASNHAVAQKPSSIGLRVGQKISIRDAINAVVIKSANDAAVVLAEAVSGSESQFALLMTRTAKSLGMNHTTFANASGLPDNRQVTTAYDLARLAVALRRDYPQYYPLFALSSFNYNGQTVYSHNRVTKNYRGADGLKTGYIRASGFNLVTSAKRGEKSIVGVVMGGRSIKSRDTNMIKLLDQAFSKMAKGGGLTEAKFMNTTAKEKDEGDSQDDSESENEDDAESAEITKNNGTKPAAIAENKKVSKSTVKPPVNTPVSSTTSGAETFSRNVVTSEDEAIKLALAASPMQMATPSPAATAQPKRDLFSPGINVASNNKGVAIASDPDDIKPLRIRVNGKRVPVPLLRSAAQDKRLVKSNISPRGDIINNLNFASAQ